MAARIPPKNTLPIFNPYEFITANDAVAATADPVVPGEIEQLQTDVTEITGFLADYCLVSTSDLGGGVITCTSMTNQSDTATFKYYPTTAVIREAGVWLWKVSLTFTTTSQFLFCEMSLVGGDGGCFANWCNPYYYNGQGFFVNQFQNVQLNSTMAFNVPYGTTASLQIKVRALLSTPSSTFTVGGNSTASYANLPGKNVTEMRIGDGIEL